MSVKENKFLYYVCNIASQLVPKVLFEQQLGTKLSSLSRFNKAELQERVDYYNKLDTFTGIGENAGTIKDLPIFQSPKEYRFDAYQSLRYFDRSYKANFIFGDVVHTEPNPTIQKSRPIAGDNANAVLLKLNRARHYVFVKDRKKFADKKDILLWRGSVYQANRTKFMEQYFDHPRCNLGQTNKGGNSRWVKPKISIEAHLDYKYILSIEGNDVATNLKWIMSSNSIAVMPKPKYETWFMEGRLIPDQHFIQVSDDFSDLEEKLNYYSRNEAAAQAIIANANKHVQQFLDREREDLISLLVLSKYFYYTGQKAGYELL